MRSLAALSTLLAVVAARRKWTGDVNAPPGRAPAHDPLRTGEWFAEHGLPPSEPAPAITTIEANKSYAVKLECVGCPHRVRASDIFLNFTIDSNAQTMLLNGKTIAPLAPLPLPIVPIPIPAGLTKFGLDKALKNGMNSHSSIPHMAQNGRLQMQFEHALVGSRQPGKTWIQFDITAIHIRVGEDKLKFQLASEEQKMVQVLLHENMGARDLSIEDIQVVLRKDRVMPFKMDCGRYAIKQTKYNPAEWDAYGKLGSATRLWHMVWWRVSSLFNGEALAAVFAVLVVASAIRGVVLLRRRCVAKRVEDEEDGVDAALLGDEDEDEPPAYDNVPEFDVKEEKAEEVEEEQKA